MPSSTTPPHHEPVAIALTVMPGQVASTPKPTPKTAPPRTACRPTGRRGIRRGAPNTVRPRRRSRASPTAAVAIVEAIIR
jgi:hypothetical protein